jgi:predicted ArsR family transcriptional regulator
MGGVRPTGKADHTPGADLWRRGKGLGKSNYRLWSLLTSPKTAAELATTLGIKVRTVWDHLWTLEYWGLCMRDVDGKWHRCDVDVDAVAKRLGIAGEGARQRARHACEREINTQRLRRRAEALSGAYGSLTESDDDSRERSSR